MARTIAADKEQELEWAIRPKLDAQEEAAMTKAELEAARADRKSTRLNSSH